MAKASFLTPTYFFSSVQKGSGKSVLLSNTAVFLNDSGIKVAIIDFEASTPLKLKKTFPSSIAIQEYSDISNLITESDNRFRKAFYFSDVDKISYFPAFNLKNFRVLFNEVILRDFYLQLQATYDHVLINLPSGTQQLKILPDVLADNRIWHGKTPLSIIISQSDKKSLVKLDDVILKNPAFSHYIGKNILLFFNKVPENIEKQHINRDILTSSQINQIFNFNNFLTMSENEEIPYQSLIVKPIVLDTDSTLRYNISRFCRVLSSLNKNIDTTPTNPFMPLLDSPLLERILPYLDKIQTLIASKFFVNKSEVQIYLEENSNNYRIRARICGLTQSIIPIERTVFFSENLPINSPPPLSNFSYNDLQQVLKKENLAQKEILLSLSVRPLFRFDDRFAQNIGKNLNEQNGYYFRKTPFVSPFAFKYCKQELDDVPSLSQMIGLVNTERQYLNFILKQTEEANITHFFIPPEFDLNINNRCFWKPSFIINISTRANRGPVAKKIALSNYSLIKRKLRLAVSIRDYFSRNWSIETDPFLLHEHSYNRIEDFVVKKLIRKLFVYPKLALSCLSPVTKTLRGKTIGQYQTPKIIPLAEETNAYKCMNKSKSDTHKKVVKTKRFFKTTSFNIKTSSFNDFQEHDFNFSTICNRFAETKDIINLNIFNSGIISKFSYVYSNKSNSKTQIYSPKHIFNEKILKFCLKLIKSNYKPDILKIEKLLMNFCFAIKVLSNDKSKDNNFNFYSICTKGNYKAFELSTNFYVGYISHQSITPAHMSIKVKKVPHRFDTKIAGFEFIQAQIKRNKSTKFDILPVYFPFSKDSSYSHMAENAYASNKILDEFLIENNLKLSCRDFLRIVINKSTKIFTNYSRFANQKLHKIPQTNLNEINLIKKSYTPVSISIAPFKSIEMITEILKLKFSTTKNSALSKTDTIFRADSLLFDKYFDFKHNAIQLFTNPFRRFNSQLSEKTSELLIPKIIAPNLSLRQPQSNINTAELKFIKKHNFVNNLTNFVNKYPLRFKTSPISNMSLKKINLEILNTPTIISTPENLTERKHDLRLFEKSVIFKSMNINIEQSPLVTLLSSRSLSIKSQKPTITIKKNKVNDILFNHLRYQLIRSFAKPLNLIDKNHSKSPTTFGPFSTTKPALTPLSTSEIYDFSPINCFQHLRARSQFKLKLSKFKNLRELAKISGKKVEFFSANSEQ